MRSLFPAVFMQREAMHDTAFDLNTAFPDMRTGKVAVRLDEVAIRSDINDLNKHAVHAVIRLSDNMIKKSDHSV